MPAAQPSMTAFALRPRLPAMAAMGALGLGLLIAPAGIATADPAKSTTTSTSARQAQDSLFPEQGSDRYDVKHYAIKLNYQTSAEIKAKTTVIAKTTKRLKSFSLDLEGLTVDAVKVNGHKADFSRRDNKLIITPSEVLDGRFSVTVKYHGKPVTHIDPDGAQDGWIPTKDGGVVVLSEPVGAMTWFPNNNTPRDKATFDMKITVPSKLEVAGSGDLRSVRKHDGQETWRWVQPKQQATYLAMISIDNFNVYRSTMTRPPDASCRSGASSSRSSAPRRPPASLFRRRFATWSGGSDLTHSTVLGSWSRTPPSGTPWKPRIGLSSTFNRARLSLFRPIFTSGPTSGMATQSR
jgi:Peptidase M1 N-terminal domain